MVTFLIFIQRLLHYQLIDPEVFDSELRYYGNLK